jgi:hypothetical protein
VAGSSNSHERLAPDEAIRGSAETALTRYAGYMMSRDKPTRWPDVYKPEGFHEADWRRAEAEFAAMIELARGLKARIAIGHIPQKGPRDASAWPSSTSCPP